MVLEEDEPTEYYGSASKAADKLLQRKHGLAEDGYIGEQTYKLLVSENAQKYSVKCSMNRATTADNEKKSDDTASDSSGSSKVTK